MPRTWVGWLILIVVVALVWKHPGSLGAALNGVVNRISIFFNSLG